MAKLQVELRECSAVDCFIWLEKIAFSKVIQFYCAILRHETHLPDIPQCRKKFASFQGVGRISSGEENLMRYSYCSLSLEHPGLIAGMFDDLGIGSH
jgi:hypothetical protein